MSDNQLAEFSAVTQANPEDAKKYLARANGDLQRAVSMFLSEQADSSSLSGSASPTNSGSLRSTPHVLGSASTSSSRTSLRSSTSGPRIATFSDLMRGSTNANGGGGGSGSGSGRGNGINSDDDPAQFFTGGERSGLAVTNPNDRRSAVAGTDASNLVNEIIRKAQQGAGTSSNGDESVQAAQSRAPRFTGRGFRLGTETDSQSADLPASQVASHADGSLSGLSSQTYHDFDDEEDEEYSDNQNVLQRTMYFWRDGFSIDDGPLYRFDDPRNDIYLRAINMGRAPIDLLKVNPQQAVDVKLVQKPDEDYVRPKLPPSLDNAGAGRRLGTSVGMAQPSEGYRQQTPTSTSPSEHPVENPVEHHTAESALGSEGDAAVQLRLADGTAPRRLRFSREGPVQQLYDYVDSVSPGGRAYVLQTSMPPRGLEDRQQSLKSAGVVGAAVIQRWV